MADVFDSVVVEGRVKVHHVHVVQFRVVDVSDAFVAHQKSALK